MLENESNFYHFGRFRLDTGDRVLFRDLEPVPLTPKVFDILLALVEQGGRVVPKDDLMKRVWPGTFVEDGNLTQSVSILRKALGESGGGPQFIETIPRRGYRFVADIRKNGEIGVTETRENVQIGVAEDKAAIALTGPAPTTSFDAPVRKKERSGGKSGSILRPIIEWGKSRSYTLTLTVAAVVVVIVGAVYFSLAGRAGAAAAGTPINSIAILPFVDDATDTDSQYLDDKLAESLINSLSKIPALRVVPRSVIANYKDKPMDPNQIGRELNVRAVVTGRVHRHGETVSIQADLIDLANVSEIWGQVYERKLADIALVQDDISRDIFENLRLKLNVEEKKHLEAYRLYLKGRNYWNKRTEDALEQGIDSFEHAIELDPNFAQAYAGLADCYNMSVVYGIRQPKDGFPKAKEAAEKALDIDETLAEAHSSLAFIKFRWDRNRVEAEREFQQAIKLKPTYVPAHQWYSSFLVDLERFDEAMVEAKKAEELEPLSLTSSAHLGWILYLSGRDDEAIRQCSRILELDPNSFPALRYLGLAFQQRSMYKEAIADFQKGVKLSGSPLVLALLGHAYAVSGKRTEALQTLSDLQDLQGQRYISPYTIAAIYAGLDDRDQTFKWLEKAFDESDIWLMNLKVDPAFGKVRADRRFTDLLTRARLRP